MTRRGSSEGRMPSANRSRRARRFGDNRGTITLWMLGLCLMTLFLGGVTFDLWRAFSERRAIAGAADAAAIAGANALDTDHFRSTGEVRLDPALGESLAWDNLKRQTDVRSLVDAIVSATPAAVSVQAIGRVQFTLLKIFMPHEAPFTVTVTATAEPRRSP